MLSYGSSLPPNCCCNILKSLIHIILLALAFQAQAQEPVYRHITEDDGLPDNEIYYLYQDKKGITWISTNSGLCRYNGQSVQHFSNPQLKAKSTGCIKEDNFGRIWVNNFSGQLFYVEHDSLVIIQLPGVNYCSSTDPFIIGPKNQLVVTSSQGELAVYTPAHKNKKDKPVYVLDTIVHSLAQNPFYSSNGTLWAANANGNSQHETIALTYDGHQVKYIPKQPGQFALHTAMFINEFNNNIYLFEREQTSLYKYNGTGFSEEQKLNVPGFKIVMPLQNGRLAFCTNSGLYISDKLQPAPHISTQLFSGQTISAFCEDGKGNLWVGTLSEGVYFIPKQGFNRLLSATPATDYNKVTTIAAGPANKLILGFLNGELGLVDRQLNYQTLQPANQLSTKVQGLYYHEALQLLNWHSEGIYQSHFSATDTKLHPYRGIGYATKDMVYIPKWNAALLANPVDIQLISLDKTAVTEHIPKGWAATYPVTTIYEKNMPWPQVSVMLSNERSRAVYFDEQRETIWGADKNGITLYRQNGKTNILLNNEPVYATSFCVHNGIIWTGTFSQGLIAIQQEKVSKQFMVKDGLTSNTIYKMLASGNHLWLATDKGLQYFDINKEEFFLVDKTMGLPSYQINGMALVNNNLFVSTPKGLLTITDTIIFETDHQRQASIQSIYCNRNIIDTAKEVFNTSENSFLFRVETPVYTNRALLRYQYRLKGLEKNFNTVNLDDAVFEYRSLSSGNYQFELYLTDTKGKTIGQPVFYAFTIKHPFYKTTAFLIFSVFLLSGIIYLLMRKRINQVKNRAQQKLKLAQLERDLKESQLSGIKAQMNPHFMFNALNSIQEFILLNDKKQANRYMGKFADLMRMTLDMTNKKDVLLEDEIKMLQLYLELEALRFEEHFTYTVNTENNVDKDHIRLPAMLIQPNIENAVKHGLLHKTGEKILEVHFSMKAPHTLCCTVTDNGIGRKRSSEINAQRLKKHTSFATGATQKRLDLLNFGKKEQIAVQYEDLVDVAGNAAGTRVSIYIPV